MLQSLSRHGQAVLAAVLVLAFPGSLLAQRGPTGLAVTGTAASATITWQAVTGGVSYSVKRWKADDLRCCNNASSSLGKPTWTDVGATNEGFSQAGIYVFEVTVVMEDRTTGTSQVSWTRPDAAPVISREALTVKTVQTLSLAAPARVRVRNDPAALVFSWEAVSGATGYQIDAAAVPEGPWTPLVPAPIAATQFAYTPPAGTLTYYRISAALSLAVSPNATIMPFIYQIPLNPLGVSAAQSGSNVIVSWNPVRGASGYTVSAPFGSLQVGSGATSATLTGVIQPGLSGYNVISVNVTAQFPTGTSGERPSLGIFLPFDPSQCWPPAGEQPGGSGQTLAPPTVTASTVTLSWTMNGQVVAYRVDRAPAGSAQWESLACVKPLTAIDYGHLVRVSSPTTVFQDQSIALRPSTSYQYRITSIGAPDASGNRASKESVVTATTAPAPILAVGAVAASAAGTTPSVRLSWPWASGLSGISLITSSYGLRLGGWRLSREDPATVFNVPHGTHSFTVTPLNLNGVPAATTTVTVVVP